MCADVRKTVEIIFGGKNELSGAVNEIMRDFKSFEKSIDGVATPLAGIAEKILGVSAAAAAMAVGGMALAVRAAGEFGSSFKEISTLIKDTGTPIKKFEDDVLSYATKSGKSLEEINKALYTSVSAGVDYTKSIDFVAAAEKLAVGGRSDLGDTTKLLIGTLNAYGQGTDQAAKYSDIMFTTVKMGLTTMTELSASLSQVTGLAASSGVPFETLSAAIAALTTSGMPTAQAITSIKAALQNVIKPTGEAEKMAASLGLQFNATALQTKGFEGVLREAWKATGGSTEKMAELFGSVEALNAVLVLSSDKQGNFKNSLLAMKDASGATEVAYGKMAGGFSQVNAQLENSFKVTLITIGKEIMPEYLKIASNFGELFKGIKIGVDSGAFDPLFKYLDTVGKSISDWLNEVAKAFPDALKQVDFTGLVEAFKSFGSAIGGLFELGDDKPKAMADAIQLVIDTTETLITVTKGIGVVFAPLIKTATEVVSGFNALDEKTKELSGNLMGLALQYKLFGPVVTLVMQAVAADTESGGNAAKMAFLAWENGINAIKVAVLSMAVAFANAALDMAKFLDYIPGYDASEDIRRTSERVSILAKMLDTSQNDLASSSMKLQDAWTGADSAAGSYTKTVRGVPTKVDTEFKVAPKLDPLATEETQWRLAQAFFQKDKNAILLYTKLQEEEAAAAKVKLATVFPSVRDLTIVTRADGSSLDSAYGMIIEKFPDGSTRIVQAQATLDKIALDNAKAKIEEAIPKEKQFEIQAKLDEAKIKGQADIIQKAIEWKAKLDIAEVEANAKKVEAAFKSIDNTITSTGTTLSSMMDSYTTLVGAGKGGTSFAEQQILDENRRRDAALAMQEELTGAQIAQMNAQTAALKKGDSIIKIEGAGLQPHLEAFMYEILKAIQIRANAEGAKFLVGV
ncbi:MAG: phage tail tape measure protein [Syntrophus sp. (in: bacteria)]